MVVRVFFICSFFADLEGSNSPCARRKENRRNVKSLVRRRKKQLFGKQKKRKKNRRYKRSLLTHFGWMFGQGGEKSRKIDNGNTKVKRKKIKVNTLLEIASKRVKDVPGDFFQVVTASSLELSQFSGHQSVKTVDSSLALPSQIKVAKTSEEKKRNYKR